MQSSAGSARPRRCGISIAFIASSIVVTREARTPEHAARLMRCWTTYLTALWTAPLPPEPHLRHVQAATIQALAALQERLRAMPGVVSIAVGPLPFVHGSDMAVATSKWTG